MANSKINKIVIIFYLLNILTVFAGKEAFAANVINFFSNYTSYAFFSSNITEVNKNLPANVPKFSLMSISGGDLGYAINDNLVLGIYAYNSSNYTGANDFSGIYYASLKLNNAGYIIAYKKNINRHLFLTYRGGFGFYNVVYTTYDTIAGSNSTLVRIYDGNTIGGIIGLSGGWRIGSLIGLPSFIEAGVDYNYAIFNNIYESGAKSKDIPSLDFRGFVYKFSVGFGL